MAKNKGIGLTTVYVDKLWKLGITCGYEVRVWGDGVLGERVYEKVDT